LAFGGGTASHAVAGEAGVSTNLGAVGSKDNTVNRPDIQPFIGTLKGAQTTRGVFVTTG
jgi:hypothetical protein